MTHLQGDITMGLVIFQSRFFPLVSKVKPRVFFLANIHNRLFYQIRNGRHHLIAEGSKRGVPLLYQTFSLAFEITLILFLTAACRIGLLLLVIRSKRDKAIFLVAYRHGLRASEIGLLQRADVDAKQGRISIHRLKGSISGVYPMQPDVLKAVRSYLRTRADESPYLFVSNRNVPIGRFMLWELMQQSGEVAGLPMEKQKFHCLKHSIATHLLDT